MGVDAGLFAKKSKRYFWFDRKDNIRAYWNMESFEEWKKMETIYGRLTDSKEGVSAEELLPFLKTNIKCWEKADEDQRYNGEWIRHLIKFVKANPDDRFFVITDHDSDWPDILDDYEEVSIEELSK